MNLRGLQTFLKRYNWSHAIAVGGVYGAGYIPDQLASILAMVLVALLIGVMSPPSSAEK